MKDLFDLIQKNNAVRLVFESEASHVVIRFSFLMLDFLSSISQVRKKVKIRLKLEEFFSLSPYK